MLVKERRYADDSHSTWLCSLYGPVPGQFTDITWHHGEGMTGTLCIRVYGGHYGLLHIFLCQSSAQLSEIIKPDPHFVLPLLDALSIELKNMQTLDSLCQTDGWTLSSRVFLRKNIIPWRGKSSFEPGAAVSQRYEPAANCSPTSGLWPGASMFCSWSDGVQPDRGQDQVFLDKSWWCSPSPC